MRNTLEPTTSGFGRLGDEVDVGCEGEDSKKSRPIEKIGRLHRTNP